MDLTIRKGVHGRAKRPVTGKLVWAYFERVGAEARIAFKVTGQDDVEYQISLCAEDIRRINTAKFTAGSEMG